VDQLPVGQSYGSPALGKGLKAVNSTARLNGNVGGLCRPYQFSRDCTHTTHRYLPLPGAVADHVVEEAAVLLQGRIMRPAEGADQSIGQHQAAYSVVAEGRLDEFAERSGNHRRPK